MRKIEHFEKKGGQLVSIRDSVTNAGSKSSWAGPTKRFWVKAEYVDAFGDTGPSLNGAKEIFLLDDGEADPAPVEGWCYARGFFS